MSRGDLFASLSKRGLRRIGILGGTFDPIHLGHLILAQSAKEKLGLDAVVFMPCATPHFKQDGNVSSTDVRLAMCGLATAGNPSFHVSDIEVARGGITYTVDTMREIKEAAPDLDVTFIIGGDNLIALDKWHGADELSQMVRFAYAYRPVEAARTPDRRCGDYGMDGLNGPDCSDGPDASKRTAMPGARDVSGTPILSDMRMHMAEAPHGFDVDRFESPEIGISSTMVRERVAHSESIRYLVPEAVRLFIEGHSLYVGGLGHAPYPSVEAEGLARKADPLSQEFFDERRRELEGRVTQKRLDHIEGVSQTAKRLAKIYGVDERKAALAGLLHDWDKGYDDEGIRARISEVGLSDVLDPFVVEKMPQVLHGPTAAFALAQEFPEIPSDVIQAIYNHTTASKDADDLEKIVYISDAIEPTRRFGAVEEIRESVGEVTLDELFYKTYKFWTLALLERDKVVHPDTMSIWNELAARNRQARRNRKGE